MLRIGVVGAGRNARHQHIPQLRAIPEVDVCAVANSTPESSARASKELGIDRAFTSWEHLVESPDVDAVLIGTYPDLHETVTVEALRNGKHVLVEARIARSASEAERMLAVAKGRPDLVSMVVPSPICFEIDPFISHLIDAGALGELVAVNAHMNQAHFSGESIAPPWRRQRERVGTNVMELGILYESIVRWTGGAHEVTAASAVHEAAIGATPETTEPTDVPDHLTVLFSFGERGRAAFQFSSVTGLAPPPTAYLFGTEGTSQIDLLEQRVLLGRKGGALEEIEVPREHRIERRTAADFVAATRGEAAITRATFEEGVRYMKFVDAVAASINRKAVIGL